ncbi:alpha/beta-hydrolase [Daedaleopsis nitida]|nr:alpha/beta-hydrolase [Daedaleopsis nitida]
MDGDQVKETPFVLSIPDATLDLLHKKLDLAHFPDELDGAAWNYGVPLADVKRLVSRWKDGFDWRKHEAEINRLPMFTRDIDIDEFGTLNIHYVHQRSEVEDAIPLLFVHGCKCYVSPSLHADEELVVGPGPGHFLEVRKLLPLLTTNSPENPSFHVVAISLPGFGFSDAPSKPGFAAPQYAQVMNRLMLSLGYDHYVYQGGDWGHILGIHAAHIYGHQHIKAWHTNAPVVQPRLIDLLRHPRIILRMLLLPFDKPAREAITVSKRFFAVGSGYMIEQASKPQTLGYGLADSPVGLLAWIYEKLVSWTDDYPWTDDEVLEWVSVYWFSRAGPAASVRIYYEMSAGNTRSITQSAPWSSIPLGVSYFPKEIARLPASWTGLLGNVAYQREHAKGGHFAATEQPEVLADDLRKMFGRGGPAFGVVPGKDGYARPSLGAQ